MDSKDHINSDNINNSMNAVQPEEPAAKQNSSISVPKSLLSSNPSKNGEALPNCKAKQAYLTIIYLLSQYNKLNSAANKNSQQAQKASEETKNSIMPCQNDSLSISQLTNIKDFNTNLLMQFQQNEQSSKAKNTKPKPVKKEKEIKSTKKNSDTSRLKFTRSKSQPNSSFFGRSEYLLTQKKIYVPTWEFVKDSTDNPDTNNEDDSSPEVQIEVRMHKRLEIYENRIANGLTKYHHPAYSVQLEKDESTNEITPTEIEEQKLNNYESVVPSQKIPRFWEPRSWDTEESYMSEEESRKLQLKIENEESEESILNLIRSPSKYKSSKKYSVYSYSSSSSSSSSQSSSSSLSPLDSPYLSGNMKKKKKESAQYTRERRLFGVIPNASYSRKSTELEISNLYYETDESCDETDVELF